MENCQKEIIVVEQSCDDIALSIKKMLEQLRPANTKSSIYRVSKQLRKMNNATYVPQVISIGPLHHDGKDLTATEKYKHQGLHNFLRRLDSKEKLLEDLVKEAESWVEKARDCYAEPINMNNLEFARMMLVDSCFIVDFFILVHDRYSSNDRKFPKIDNNVDLSFYQGIFPDFYFDLIKLENQVPFFVLKRLFGLIPKQDTTPTISFVELALKFLRLGWQHQEFDDGRPDEREEPEHLVHLLSLHYIAIPLVREESYFFLFKIFPNMNHNETSEKERSIPPSITELWEAGVTIQKADNFGFITTICFNNGVLEMSPLVIDGYLETTIRNLIAFQHFYAKNREMVVIQYVIFMDHLISTKKDVNLLVEAGIIINKIGCSNKEVSDLFNNLGNFVTMPGTTTDYYDQQFNAISEALRKHCSRWWNKSKASLKHNYFNTPWAIISFVAAIFIIILTLLQTIFSTMSTFK